MIARFGSSKSVQMPALAFWSLVVVTLVTSWLAYHEWRALSMIRPEFSINDVYVAPVPDHPLALVAEYQNVGKARMDWLDAKISLIDNGRIEDTQPSMTVVRANPTPAGAVRSIVLDVKSPPKAVAMCVRWLGPAKALASSQWYFVVDPKNSSQGMTRYMEATGNDRVSMVNLQTCPKPPD